MHCLRVWIHICCCLALLLVGCATRRSHPATAGINNGSSGYVDLQPGWWIRVVTPVLKSGGYKLQFKGEQQEGNKIVVSAGDDFVGYETSYYSVKERKGGGVRVKFSSAAITKQG